MKKRDYRLKEISQIAHDISSPLTVIKWFAVASKTPETLTRAIETIQGCADTIKDRAKRNDVSLMGDIDAIVKKMADEAAAFWKYALEFDSTDNDLIARKKLALNALGKIGPLLSSLNDPEETSTTACDLAHVIGHAVNETRPYAEQKGIRLSYKKKNAPAVTDAQKINRVVVNIINNAIEARGTKKVHLRMMVSESLIRIEAFDNGEGIDRNEITKIFDHGFTAGKSGGSGLGLAFCKRTVEENGGKIAAHSTKGVGTIFAVTLPTKKMSGSPDDSLWE